MVEKAKARVAYENTIRQKIDPGLVEKTKGNNFRTRIYPIPAKGYKRVLIGIEQTLVWEKGGLLYRLPLTSEQVIKEFKITEYLENNYTIEVQKMENFSIGRIFGILEELVRLLYIKLIINLSTFSKLDVILMNTLFLKLL